MPKKVTMDGIAAKLGISKNTVSLALRGMPGISESTRAAIVEAAEKMGYRYKTANEKETARNLCLVIARSTLESVGFFSFIQLGIEDEAKKNNINTIVHYYEENEDGFEMPNCIRDGIAAGIITLGRISRKTIDTIQTYELPVVMVDNYFDDIVTDCILTDNQCGGYVATKYLIENGHSEIGFLGDIAASVSFYDRYQGYLKALKCYGLKAIPEISIIDKKFEITPVKELTAILEKIKANPGLPTAYFCCNDAEAIALMKGLKQMGFFVPEDVSVMGFDDIEAASGIIPELTTMRVQKELMGKASVTRLLEKIDGQEGIVEKILLTADLVKRQSVRKIGW